MIIERLSAYINDNAPMTNIPELLSLHHGNPLGLHPIVIPIFLLVLAIAMHVVTYFIRSKERRSLYPLLYILVGLAVVSIIIVSLMTCRCSRTGRSEARKYLSDGSANAPSLASAGPFWVWCCSPTPSTCLCLP